VLPQKQRISSVDKLSCFEEEPTQWSYFSSNTNARTKKIRTQIFPE
jgi:hypothetical protein